MSIIYTGVQQSVNIQSPLDKIAELIGLSRLPGESLASFKTRVLDVYVHRASASSEGLYNGINRELGYDGYSGGIIIDIDRDSNDIPVQLLSIEIDYDGVHVISPGSSRITISTVSRTGGGFFVKDLIATLNTVLSNSLTVTKFGTCNDYDKSSYLKHVKSIRHVWNRTLKQTKMNTFYGDMDEGNFFSGDITFSQSAKLTTRKNEGDSLQSTKEYIVRTYARSIQTLGYPVGSVSFSYEAFPLVVPVGHIKLKAFKNESVIHDVLEQEVHDSGTINGIPGADGADYINELLSVAPMYWGE